MKSWIHCKTKTVFKLTILLELPVRLPKTLINIFIYEYEQIKIFFIFITHHNKAHRNSSFKAGSIYVTLGIHFNHKQ